MRILLAEDDQLIVQTLSELLAGQGHVVDSSPTQDGAVALATRPGADYGCALVDLTLAQGNGFAVCNAVKAATPSVPVIFLTAADDELNVVTGLSMGADDYVRRSSPAPAELRLGDVVIDPDRARAEKGGRELSLSALEYRLLLLLARSRGRLVTRDMMRDALWDDAGAYVEENTLSVYVKRLRDKVEDDPAHPRLIVTSRGLGYRVAE